MSIFSVRKCYTAPTVGPKSSLLTQWFIKAVEPWLLAALQEIARTMPRGDQCVDIRDMIGEVSTGSDAKDLMACFATLPLNVPMLDPGRGLTLEQTLRMSNRGGMKLTTGRDGRAGIDGNASVMRWRGEEGGRMIFFDRDVMCELAGYAVELDAHQEGTGPTAYVGVDIDGFGGTQQPNEPYFYGYGSQCSVHHMQFHANRQNEHYEMLRISKTVEQNQEYHNIAACNFYAGDPVDVEGPRKGTALVIGPGANDKAEQINETNMKGFAIGIHLQGGSAHMGTEEFCNFTSNDIDVQQDGGFESTCIRANSENSRQFYVNTAHGSGFTILSGTRLGPAACRPGTGYIVPGHTLSVQPDVSFDEPPPKGATLFDFSDCMIAVLIAPNFAGVTTFEQSGYGTMKPYGDHLLISIGHHNLVPTPGDESSSIPLIYIRGGGMKWEAERGDDLLNTEDRLLELIMKTTGTKDVRMLLARFLTQPGNAPAITGLDLRVDASNGPQPKSVTPIAVR